MSSAAHSPQLDALAMTSRPAARKTRGLFITFATLVVIGLGLAAWYVSERIASPQPQAATPAPVAASQTAQAFPAAAPTVLEAPTTPTPLTAPEPVLPLALEYYLQIASLGTPEDAGFMKHLEDKGYRTEFEAAGAGHEARILIGPYSDEKSLKRAGEKLMSAGVLGIEYVR